MIGSLNSPIVALLQSGEPGKPVAAPSKKLETSDEEGLPRQLSSGWRLEVAASNVHSEDGSSRVSCPLPTVMKSEPTFCHCPFGSSVCRLFGLSIAT